MPHKSYLYALVFLLIGSPTSLLASPASPAMLDGKGCHVCKDVCEKFGVAKNEYHCHIFSPESIQAYKRAAAGGAANSEAMLAQNIMLAVDYISLKANKSGLLIGAITKKLEGHYKIVSQSCGFGDEGVTIKAGPPEKIKKVFGVTVNPTSPGLFSVRLQNTDYLAIGTANNRLSVVNNEDDIVCSGQSVNDNIYLYCKASLSPEKRAGSSGICRTSLAKK